MSKYYYVGTLLPSLSFDAAPDMSFAELQPILQDQLSVKDLEKVKLLRQFYDLLNLKALWLHEPLDMRGGMDRVELEDVLAGHSGMAPFVYEFLSIYEKTADRVRHFPQLLAQFFQAALKEKDPLLQRYFRFERESRLILTALRAKKMKRDLAAEFCYENSEEEWIAQILAQKDAKDFEPPENDRDLKMLFDKYADQPLDLQKAFDQYRFESVEKMVDLSDQFSIERILVHLIQLILVEHALALDKNKGKAIVETLIKET